MSEKSKMTMSLGVEDVGNLIPVFSVLGWTRLCSPCSAEDVVTASCRPSEWSNGVAIGCCGVPNSYYCQCQCCRISDIDGEICLLADLNCREVIPVTCCEYNIGLCCLQGRLALPKPQLSIDDKADIPCTFTILGFTLCLDGNFRCGCCQSYNTLKTGEWIDPGIPLVVGSCKNCEILSQGLSACSESYKSNSGNKVKADTDLYKVSTKIADSTKSLAGKLGKGGTRLVGKTRFEELHPFMACCCSIHSCYTVIPDMFGCFLQGTYLGIFTANVICCKPAIKRMEVFMGDLKICFQGRVALTVPRTFFSVILQTFYCENRCAFPPDINDVPYVLNCCYCNCCFNFEPTFGNACCPNMTLFAPLKQFTEDYQGEKQTIFDLFAICGGFKKAEKVEVADMQLVSSISPEKDDADDKEN